MKHFQNLVAAAAVILPSLLSTPYVAAQGNVTAELMPVRTNGTIGSNATAFVEGAAEAIGYTLQNLLANNEDNLYLCPGSGDNDQEDDMYNCDETPGNGTYIADITFDFAETLQVEQLLANNTALSANLSTIIYDAALLMARENTTGLCARLFDYTTGEDDFTVFISIANAAKPVYALANVTFGAVSFETNNTNVIFDYCRIANYTTGVAPGLSEDTIAAMAVSLVGTSPTFAGQLVQALLKNAGELFGKFL